MQEQIVQDVFITHGYKQGQEILISAEFLVGVVAFCRKVQESQPQIGALLQYPRDVKVIKSKEDERVLRVDIDWENHSKESFANTSFSENGGVPIVTDLAMHAIQIENVLVDVHLDNINNGIAVKTSSNESTNT